MTKATNEQIVKISEIKLNELFNDNLKAFLQARDNASKKDIFLNEMLTLAVKLWSDYRNKSGFLALFIREYRLYPMCKNYFEDNGVCFVYNAKKDELKIFGEFTENFPSYSEWKANKKVDDANEKAALKASFKTNKEAAVKAYKEALSKRMQSLNENKEALKQALNELIKEIK